MKITYYRTEWKSYVAVTDESDDGIRFVGRGPSRPTRISSVCDQHYSPEQLRKWARVDRSDVPADWLKALGYPEMVEESIPEPEPIPIFSYSGDNVEAFVEPTGGYYRAMKSRYSERERRRGVTVIDVMFPWEAASARYDQYGRRIRTPFEVGSTFVFSLLYFWIIWQLTKG